jgi:protein-arginine kinase activator protein McsA
MLCEICHEREATVHNTEIAGDVQKTRDLCEQCFQATEPARAGDLAAALKAGCRYCGGEPYAGGGSPLPGPTGVHGITFMCKPCSEEYYRVLDHKIPGFVECARTATVTDDLIAKMRACDFSAILTEIEDHMKKWVAERGER